MHSFRFEQKDSEWQVYLESRDKPIGRVFLDAGGEWFGEMRLDGHRFLTPGKTPQTIIDEFEAWVAADMPPRTITKIYL
jgi:hypothetical protein